MKNEQKNKFQNKSKKAEIDEAEIIISDEIETDEIDEQNEQVPSDDEQIESSNIVPVAEIKPVAEIAEISNKQKIKALKRALENKKFTLDREKTKVKDWRVQATDRDKKATDEYEKRKNELQTMLQKTEDRFQKRMDKTLKWWHQYSDNYEVTKIKSIEDDIVLLQTELSKLEIIDIEAY